VLPLANDEDIDKKFFSNPTVLAEEKSNAIAAFATENKLSEIVQRLLNEVVQLQHTEHLKEVVATYLDLMRRVRCEATAQVTFGRVPSLNEVAKVKQLLASLRSPTQYYINQTLLVDPDIGGGFILNMGEFELDGSLNTRCSEVHKHLVKSLQE